MILTAKQVRKLLPKRPKDANKGTFGKVLVIAGSKAMPGAARLVCEAAYRVGAGLVTLAASDEIYKLVATELKELTFIDFAEKNLIEKLSKFDVVVIGPGLGQGLVTQKIVEYLLQSKLLPKSVIDADALNILSKMRDWWKKFKFKAILIPHPKEMSRLTKLPVEKIQANRENTAKKYSLLWKQAVVLKGARTVIASGNKNNSSPFANPLLATAGTGDVLAGTIAGLIAQGLNLFDAASAGVFIHGQAAEQLKAKFGESGMLATDLLGQLPLVIKKLRS